MRQYYIFDTFNFTCLETPFHFHLENLFKRQQVNPGSLADQAGLRTGDIIVKIQGQNAEVLLHKDAQDVIQRAGNYLDITVMRHGSCLDVKVPPPVLPRPQHTQTGYQHHVSSTHGMPMTGRPLSTSFENPTPISSSTLPLAPPLSVQKYNSPIGLYSMKNIKEAIDAHSQVLAPGVKGINFMKPEASVNTHSPVYQAVLEEEAKAAKMKSGPGSSSSPFMESNLLAEQQYHEVLRDTSLSPSVQSSSFRRLQENFGGVGSDSLGSSCLAAKQQPNQHQQQYQASPQTTTIIPISMPTTSPFQQQPPSSSSIQSLQQQSLPNPIISSVTAPSTLTNNSANNSQPLSWMETMNDKRNKCPTCGQTLPRN